MHETKQECRLVNENNTKVSICRYSFQYKPNVMSEFRMAVKTVNEQQRI